MANSEFEQYVTNDEAVEAAEINTRLAVIIKFSETMFPYWIVILSSGLLQQAEHQVRVLIVNAINAGIIYSNYTQTRQYLSIDN